jgi:hypothetical protein
VIYPLVHFPTTIVFKTVVLLLGALITFFAYRAYSRTGARPLGMLALGFAIVTLGSLLAGVIDVGLGGGRQLALVVESGLTAVGFAVIVYSLYTR